jgi:Golgi nucleoside diphosphatase
VAELNDDILKTINDDAQTFISVNSVEQRSEDKTFYINNKYFHTLKVSKISSARLMLKINAPIILMRNMNPAKEFYNNIRYIVKRMYSRVIKVEISFGEFKGRYITLSRILCNFNKLNFKFIFTRRQFFL